MSDGTRSSVDSLPIPERRMPREPLRVPIDDARGGASVPSPLRTATSVSPPSTSVPPPHISIAPPHISVPPPARTPALDPSLDASDDSGVVTSGFDANAPAAGVAAASGAVEPSEANAKASAAVTVVTQSIVSVGVSAPRPAAAELAGPKSEPAPAPKSEPAPAPRPAPLRSMPPPPPPEAMRTPSIPPPSVGAAPVAAVPASRSAVSLTSVEVGLDVEDDGDADELDMDDADIEDAAPAAANPAPAAAPVVSAKPPAPPPAAPPPAPAPQNDRAKKYRNWFDTFFNDDYLRTVRPPSAKSISRQVDFIEKSLASTPGQRILDVGSGLGYQANELARRGYQVFGIDSSKTMVTRASEDAADYGVEAVFFQGDMREMTFDVQFDALLCWGTTFGYFEDEVNRLVLVRMRDALREGGRLLLEVVNRDFVIRSQPNLVWFEGDACVCMEETQFNSQLSTLEVSRNVMLDEGRQRESHYAVRLYSLHELQRELEQFGFRVLSVSGATSTPGVFFGADAPRIIILAERRFVSAKVPTTPVRTSLAPSGG